MVPERLQRSKPSLLDLVQCFQVIMQNAGKDEVVITMSLHYKIMSL